MNFTILRSASITIQTTPKIFERVCRILYNALSGGPKIPGHYMIHMILLIDSLTDEYARGWESRLALKLHEFEVRRSEASSAVRGGQDTEYEKYYTEYGQWTQTRSDDPDIIRRRHAFFSEKMLESLAPTRLDSTRNLSELERRTVFFRDMESCQWCRMQGDGHRVPWDECEIHHVTPHAEGRTHKYRERRASS